MSLEPLKPCPFCGSAAIRLRGLRSEGPLVGCSSECEVEVAEKDWNRRSPTGGQEAEILKGVAEWANADGGPGIGPLVKAWLRTQIGTQQWTMGAAAVYAAIKEAGNG